MVAPAAVFINPLREEVLLFHAARESPFGFNSPEEVERFLNFIEQNPNHVYRGDGMEFSCAVLKELYIDTDSVRDPLTDTDCINALRRYGWIR